MTPVLLVRRSLNNAPSARCGRAVAPARWRACVRTASSLTTRILFLSSRAGRRKPEEIKMIRNRGADPHQGARRRVSSEGSRRRVILKARTRVSGPRVLGSIGAARPGTRKDEPALAEGDGAHEGCVRQGVLGSGGGERGGSGRARSRAPEPRAPVLARHALGPRALAAALHDAAVPQHPRHAVLRQG